MPSAVCEQNLVAVDSAKVVLDALRLSLLALSSSPSDSGHARYFESLSSEKGRISNRTKKKAEHPRDKASE